MKPKIGIVSFSNDLHAMIIDKLLREKWECDSYYIEIDKIAGSDAIEWSIGNEIPSCKILSNCGKINPSDLDVIWWRRTTNRQKHAEHFDDEPVIELINKDSKEALLGALTTTFHGRWISHPNNTQLASNKLLQLQAAQIAGLSIPKTLITQSAADLREFFDSLNEEVIVKPLNGTSKQILYTRRLLKEDIEDAESIACVPMLYQECIHGVTHYRVNVFGKSVIAFEIESQDLDWRGNLSKPIRQCKLPEQVEERIIHTLDILKLEMGAVDLKKNEAGDFIWFEVNPQGQFLFLEGLTNFDLKNEFCRFLSEVASEAKQNIRRSKSYNYASNSPLFKNA